MFWLLFLLWPQPVAAHVRWFVNTALPTERYSLSEPAVWLAIGAILVGLTLCYTLQPLEQRVWKKIQLPITVFPLLRIIGLLSILPTILLLPNWIELLPYVGFIVYLLTIKSWPRFAITVLMAGCGLSLSLLAFDEKLLHPGLALAFLQEHQWNFLTQLGVSWFDDRLFVLYAGAVELTLGLALTLGLSPRFTIMALLTVLITTAGVLGWAEALGHLVLVITQGLFLVESTRLQPYSVMSK